MPKSLREVKREEDDNMEFSEEQIRYLYSIAEQDDTSEDNFTQSLEGDSDNMLVESKQDDEALEKVADILSQTSGKDKDMIITVLKDLSAKDDSINKIIQEMANIKRVASDGEVSSKVADIALAKLLKQFSNRIEKKIRDDMSIDELLKLVMLKQIIDNDMEKRMSLMLSYMKEIEKLKIERIKLETQFKEQLLKLQMSILKQQLEKEKREKIKLMEELEKIKEMIQGETQQTKSKKENAIAKIIDKVADVAADTVASKVKRYIEEDEELDDLIKKIARVAGSNAVQAAAEQVSK